MGNMKKYIAKVELEVEIEARNKKDAKDFAKKLDLDYACWNEKGCAKTKKHKIVCIDEIVANK